MQGIFRLNQQNIETGENLSADWLRHRAILLSLRRNGHRHQVLQAMATR
jgi:hypothetical protein